MIQNDQNISLPISEFQTTNIYMSSVVPRVNNFKCMQISIIYLLFNLYT